MPPEWQRSTRRSIEELHGASTADHLYRAPTTGMAVSTILEHQKLFRRLHATVYAHTRSCE